MVVDLIVPKRDGSFVITEEPSLCNNRKDIKDNEKEPILDAHRHPYLRHNGGTHIMQ